MDDFFFLKMTTFYVDDKNVRNYTYGLKAAKTFY